jgi:HPt (histidine-containing phosphotransfer) domain-containing protein
MDKNETPPLDFDAALQQFDDDRDFLFEMLVDYKASLPERMKEIHAAFQEGNAEKLNRHAHNLKGISLNFHANPVIELALQIESASKRNDLTGMSVVVARLDEEVRRLDEYLSNLRDAP